MDWWKLYSRTISQIKTSTTVWAEKGWHGGMKWLHLLSLSATTIPETFPFDFGSPFMQSIEISSHTLPGMGRGWSSPAGATDFVLFLWQTIHLATCFFFFFFFFFYVFLQSLQELFLNIRLYIRKYPEWPPRIVSGYIRVTFVAMLGYIQKTRKSLASINIAVFPIRASN